MMYFCLCLSRFLSLSLRLLMLLFSLLMLLLFIQFQCYLYCQHRYFHGPGPCHFLKIPNVVTAITFFVSPIFLDFICNCFKNYFTTAKISSTSIVLVTVDVFSFQCYFYTVSVTTVNDALLHTQASFKKLLLKIWFYYYRRATDKDSSSFEHVFVGEITKRRSTLKVGGFHNWVKYYLMEKAGKVDYKGYHRYQSNEVCSQIILKPWPNGLASRRKSTQGLAFRLATQLG